MMRHTLHGDRTFHYWAAGLLAIGLGLRFHQVGELELWLDEALTGYLAHTDNWLLRVHNSPPLYFLLIRGWSGLFGLGEVSLRALSVLSSGLLIPVAMYAGRSVFTREAGIAAGLVVVFSPISIYYAQEARPYALLVTELMLVYWLLWRARVQPGRTSWILLSVTTAAAIYTHNLAVIPLALGYLLAILRGWLNNDSKQCLRYFLAGGAAVCLYLPWLAWWLSTTDFHTQDMSWLTQFWNVYPTWRLPVDSLLAFYHAANFVGGAVVGKQFSGEAAFTGMALLSILCVVIVFLLLVQALFSKPGIRAAIVALMILLVLPLLALLIISAYSPVYLPGRYDLIAYPPFVLLTGLALACLKEQLETAIHRPAAFLICAVLLVPPAIRTLQFYSADGGRISTSTADYIHEQARVQDLVLMEGNRGIETVYYLQLLGYTWKDGECRPPTPQRAFTCRFLPTNLESAPAAVTRHWRAQRDGILAKDTANIVQKRSYNNVYVLARRVNTNSSGIEINESVGPVLTLLQEQGYYLIEARPDLNLIRFRTDAASISDGM